MTIGYTIFLCNVYVLLRIHLECIGAFGKNCLDILADFKFDSLLLTILIELYVM